MLAYWHVALKFKIIYTANIGTLKYSCNQQYLAIKLKIIIVINAS